jgi:hypothetical protein
MATTLRALVMLSVLVGLPAAWIYYGPLPPQAQRVVDRVVGAAKEAIGWNRPLADHARAAAVVKYESATAPVWIGAQPTATPLAEAPPLLEPKPVTFAERVEPLLARLRQLGAVAYDLELWGDGGKLYRFHCEMPLGAGAELTQQFEAVAQDPQQSVEQVVAQVSEWQLAQQRGGM